MAHNNIEVEIKIPLSKKEFVRIKNYLEKNSSFIKSSHHKDRYYTPKKGSFLDKKYPYEWLTMRERDGRVLFNYKHWYPENTKYTTHCDEYETEVKDSKSLAKMLIALNFKEFVTVEKKRLIFVYKGKFEIALDEVKNLGYFIEVEALKEFGGPTKAHEEILKFTKSLGLNQTKTVPGGYGAELMRKKGLMK